VINIYGANGISVICISLILPLMNSSAISEGTYETRLNAR
jgi:hypothetical protein